MAKCRFCFLFSGTIFYAGADGQFQVQQISWNNECVYPMRSAIWKEMMERHYPNARFSRWKQFDGFMNSSELSARPHGNRQSRSYWIEDHDASRD